MSLLLDGGGGGGGGGLMRGIIIPRQDLALKMQGGITYLVSSPLKILLIIDEKPVLTVCKRGWLCI